MLLLEASSPTPLMAVAIATVVVLLLAVLWAGWAARLYIERRRRWALVDIKGDFTREHHLPETVPVPLQQQGRVKRGDFTLDEAVTWISDFLKERKRHAMVGEYRKVLRKYDLYREMGKRMGRGQWRQVDQIGRRLAELDPLDPSAAVARGRAMRELGDFPHAIRHYQHALDLTPFHSSAFPEMAATCRAIGQPGKFRAALDRARQELGDTHPLTLEGRIQLGELVRVYADPTDPATLAHIPREQYLENVRHSMEEMQMDPTRCLQVGQAMLADDMPELAEDLVHRCESDFGECPQSLLLAGLLEHYRINYAEAEKLILKAMEREDTAEAHMELGRLLLARASLQEKDAAEKLRQAADQQLRLAIDRDPNLADAIVMLVEPAWDQGLEGICNRIDELIAAYPKAWAPLRVMGDANVSEGEPKRGVECYLKGIAIENRDELLLPCLGAMEEAGMNQEMLELVRGISRISERDPQLRWKASQVMCENRHFGRARRLLQGLVDDEQVPPQLRQRANDVLDELDDMERKRTRASKRKGKAS